MSTPVADVTPNVVLGNPTVRKALNWVVGTAAVLVPLLIVIDGRADAFDISGWTDPAAAGTSFLAGLLGLAVTIPNIPSKEKAIVTAAVAPAAPVADEGFDPRG